MRARRTQLLLLAFALACARQPAAPRRTLALAGCHPKGLGREAQCGTLRVFEDRARKAGRTIDLGVVVLPATAPDASPDPLFLLAGGPGQGAIKAFAPLLPVLQGLRKTREVVLVDQRGTGLSRELACPLHDKDAPLAVRLEGKVDAARLQKCLAALDADPRFYTTAAAMDDLDDVRAALGYERINLLGGSYGTRAALIYARQHPDHLRAMVLDGVAPVGLKLPLSFARDAQRTLGLLFDDCRKDAVCNARFPNLQRRFDELLKRLGAQPAVVRVADPLTGEPTSLTITRRLFAEQLRGLLYSPELTALLPLTLERAAEGDFAPFIAQADALAGRAGDSIAVGMMLSVICTEDAPAIGTDEIARLTQDTFLGPYSVTEFLDACKVWPHGATPAGWREPVRSEAPALLLSGELDPVTPPSWAEEALRTLPNGRSVVVAGVGHGVTAIGCVPDLIARFIKAGTAQGLDTSCTKVVKRPGFFLSFAGPPP